MSTQKLFGQSTLADNETPGVLHHGEIALMTDGDGRSEVHITNTETGDVEILSFSGDQSKPVAQMIEAIRSVHMAVDLDTSTP